MHCCFQCASSSGMLSASESPTFQGNRFPANFTVWSDQALYEHRKRQSRHHEIVFIRENSIFESIHRTSCYPNQCQISSRYLLIDSNWTTVTASTYKNHSSRFLDSESRLVHTHHSFHYILKHKTMYCSHHLVALRTNHINNRVRVEGTNWNSRNQCYCESAVFVVVITTIFSMELIPFCLQSFNRLCYNEYLPYSMLHIHQLHAEIYISMNNPTNKRKGVTNFGIFVVRGHNCIDVIGSPFLCSLKDNPEWCSFAHRIER